MQQYTYAVNNSVLPTDPSFKESGGEIYVIFVHGGSVTFSPNCDPLPMTIRFGVSSESFLADPDAALASAQLPESDSGVQTSSGSKEAPDYECKVRSLYWSSTCHSSYAKPTLRR
ncbi:hypothetical protein HGRIS_000076 [Hohenbuehelia grisea]|uniref:Uncharacterized protein n=1 Tax=Hohenbuehelia grisea TaxID=104357 RepID=A0ABR3JRU6_9AGAR